ncbi:endonuclease YncB(thermonuclease family) [Bacillus niacini]|uniref:Endonuclease YncB(Thermonuclease family) n=1 Tax=Neobacillus niacini TaxID=86668 RepID=A0A852TE23_9BACI|nr:thermonuclease family protein [Neobacillus niacini]NYE07033.1 endonuclease YncB(thermonuclease family) [Neobacillus niacini]
MRKRKGGIAMIAAATCIAFYSMPSQKEETAPENSLQMTENKGSEVPVKLINIIDGDTIKVNVNGNMETVRYLLIDTPESKNPNTCVQFYAKEAFLRNSELVKSGKLTLEFEQGNMRDSYGRLLAYVFVDGESIQGTLLKEGYARVAFIMNPPYKYLETFRKEENLAKEGKINIWSRENYVTNWGFNGCLHEKQIMGWIF